MAKRCTRCLEWKEASAFYRDRTKLDGLKSQCKDCRRAYKRDYRERKRAARRAHLNRSYKRVWQPRKLRRREIIVNSEGFQRWQEKRRAKREARIKHYLRRWHKYNPDASHRYHARNKELGTAQTHKYRASKTNATINDLSGDEWKWLKEEYGHRCAYCGKTTDALTPDHVTPLSRGGYNTLSNIVPACPTCNHQKGARTPGESGMQFTIKVDVVNRFQQQAFL